MWEQGSIALMREGAGLLDLRSAGKRPKVRMEADAEIDRKRQSRSLGG